MRPLLFTLLIGVTMTTTVEADPSLDKRIDDAASRVESKVIACRRDT